MKLTWQRITAHTKYPFRIARAGSSVGGDGSTVERIIVSIAHGGTVGLGEAAPTPYYRQSLDSVEQTLAQAAPHLGDDPADVDAIIDRLLEHFDDQRATVAAIDMALHDWLGKSRQQPVWSILGLDPTQTPPTSMTIGLDSLELLERKVADAADFAILKIKVGTGRDVETLTALRSLAPHQRIRVDANCGWPPESIGERMREIARFGLELVEQPTSTGALEAVRAARAHARVPLVADEDSVRPADVPALAGVYDGVNIKLSKCGGLREALRMIDLAREHNLKIMLGCMVETSLGVAAAAQIASLADYVDLDGHLLLADDPFTGLGLRDGVVTPGDGPGLGVTPCPQP
ncbi:MAG: dipeptide epimerase [bacterium]|nr:dipeptide epimerase [bacterium]